jgi:hypothetical protein
MLTLAIGRDAVDAEAVAAQAVFHSTQTSLLCSFFWPKNGTNLICSDNLTVGIMPGEVRSTF